MATGAAFNRDNRHDDDDEESAPVSNRVLNRLDNLAEDVGDLKVAMARLETKLEHLAPKSGLARDGAITVSGGAVGSALLFLIQHLVK